MVLSVPEAVRVVQENQDVDASLRRQGGPALAKLVLAADRDSYALRARLRHLREVEVAIDGVDLLLTSWLGFAPSVFSLSTHHYSTFIRAEGY